jgi:hypothetical protein
VKRVRPEEVGAVDLGTWMQGPEQIYLAIAIQPPNDTQIITAHRTLDGAKKQIESYTPSAEGSIEKVPLLP